MIFNYKRFYGRFAEILSIILLSFKFYYIISVRFRSNNGEIDIIAKKGKLLVFVEVKYRSNSDPVTSVSIYQRRRIVKTSNDFLKKHPNYVNYDLRFDMIGFKNFTSFPIHIKNAWDENGKNV